MWVVPALEELSLEAADVGRGWPWSNCHRRLPMWEGLALEELPSEAADVGGACPGGIVIGGCRCVRGLPWRNRMLPMCAGPALEESGFASLAG